MPVQITLDQLSSIIANVALKVREDRLLDDDIGPIFVDRPNAVDDEEESESESEDVIGDDVIFEEFMFDYGGNAKKGDHANVMLAVGDVDPTNYPKQGDDKKVSLRNSEYPLFDRAFADKIKSDYPKIWDKGGNVLGNTQYSRLTKVLDKNGKVETETDEKAIRLRESWSARHLKDFRLAGTVAQIKWLVIGEKGEQYMKDLIRKEIKDMENKTMENKSKSTVELRCVNTEQLDSGFNRFQLKGEREYLGLNVNDINVRAYAEDGSEIDVEESLRAVDGRGRPAKYYMIEGVASSTSIDSYGTEMSYECLMSMQSQFQAGVPLLPRHTSRSAGGMAEWDEVIGRTYEGEIMQSDVLAAYTDGKQYTLNVRSRLYGDDKLARELVKRLRRGEPIGQSIGGWFDEVDVITNTDGEIERVIVESVALDHLAITRAPANPDSNGLATYSKDNQNLKNIISELTMKKEETTEKIEQVEERVTIETTNVEERAQVEPTTMTEPKATEDRHVVSVEEDDDYVKVVYEKSHDDMEYTKERMEDKIKELMDHEDTKGMMKEYMLEMVGELMKEEMANNMMEFDELATSKADDTEQRDLDSSAVIDKPVEDDHDVNGGPDMPAPLAEELKNNPFDELERAINPFHDDLPLADEDVEWSWDVTRQDEVLGEGLDNWDRYNVAHVYRDDNENKETKGAYKLPIALMIDGELRAVWNGVVAAMGAVNGARGGVDLSDDDRQKAYDVLSEYYAKFDREPPMFKASSHDEEDRSEKDHNKQKSVILQSQTIMGETMNEETMKMFADLVGRSVATAIDPITERLNNLESEKTEPVIEKATIERSTNEEVAKLQAIIEKQNELLERALKEPQRVGMRGQAHKGIGAQSAIESLSVRAMNDGAVGLSAIVSRHIDAISEERSMNDMSVHTIQQLLSAGLRAAEQDGLLGSVDNTWQ
tara:strand:- start:16871 stop:19684 length:2814 start_codon:yes stop_codon:yes gene_type:complete